MNYSPNPGNTCLYPKIRVEQLRQNSYSLFNFYGQHKYNKIHQQMDYLCVWPNLTLDIVGQTQRNSPTMDFFFWGGYLA
jgi:hypothetical protein